MDFRTDSSVYGSISDIMQTSLLLLGIVLFIVVDVTGVPQCPAVDGPDAVYFPDETDCSKFYECSNGTPYLFDCPDGLDFNPTLNVCDWPDEAGCRNKNNSTSSSTTERSTSSATPSRSTRSTRSTHSSSSRSTSRGTSSRSTGRPSRSTSRATPSRSTKSSSTSSSRSTSSLKPTDNGDSLDESNDSDDSSDESNDSKSDSNDSDDEGDDSNDSKNDSDDNDDSDDDDSDESDSSDSSHKHHSREFAEVEHNWNEVEAEDELEDSDTNILYQILFGHLDPREGEICTQHTSSGNLKVYPNSCTKYILCYGGKSIVKTCAKLYNFAPEIRICVPPGFTQCTIINAS